MVGYVEVPEPGSVVRYRHERFGGPLRAGTVEEQIAAATKLNLEEHSGFYHKDIQLYRFSDDCPHSNPDQNPKYDGIDDDRDEWIQRNIPDSLTWQDGPLYVKNVARAESVLPAIADYSQKMLEYGDTHVSLVCLLSPAGTACAGCEGEDNDMYEGFPCARSSNAKERQHEFWWMFHTDNKERTA